MIDKVDYSKCRGCRICADFCPEDVLRLDTSSSEFPSCQSGCPAGADIRHYMYLLNQGNLSGAVKSISESLPMPAITGRVCAHPCELSCARKEVDESVNVAAIERFLGDLLLKQKITSFPRLHAKQIAVIGSGPAGLSAADYLARHGYPVTVIESQPMAGGMLRYGIPEYRLPRKVLDSQLSYMESMGIEFVTSVTFGRDLTPEELEKKGYKAILIATGANKSLKLGVPGENINNIYSGLDFLKSMNSGEKVNIGKQVVVVGGGNVAIDSARAAIRSGAEEVTIIYRRSREEMPAYVEGIADAESEGVQIQFYTSPIRFLSNGADVTSLECIKGMPTQQHTADKSQPVPLNNSQFIINADTVVIAIGETADTNLWADKDMPELFICGDAISGSSSVIEAIASGKKAAARVENYLTGIKDGAKSAQVGIQVKTPPKEGIAKMPRIQSPVLSVGRRKNNFKEVKGGFSEDIALTEASRCMTCGGKAYIAYLENCMTCYNCEMNCPDKAINVDPMRKVMPILIRHPGDKTNYDVLYTAKNNYVPLNRR